MSYVENLVKSIVENKSIAPNKRSCVEAKTYTDDGRHKVYFYIYGRLIGIYNRNLNVFYHEYKQGCGWSVTSQRNFNIIIKTLSSLRVFIYMGASIRKYNHIMLDANVKFDMVTILGVKVPALTSWGEELSFTKNLNKIKKDPSISEEDKRQIINIHKFYTRT